MLGRIAPSCHGEMGKKKMSQEKFWRKGGLGKKKNPQPGMTNNYKCDRVLGGGGGEEGRASLTT